MKSLIQNIIVVFLALVIAGAVSFCLSSQMIAMAHNVGDMATHVGALTAATINTLVLVVAAMTLFVVALASIHNEQKPGVAAAYTYEDVVSIIKKRIFRWLAIFERSPNATQTT